MSAQERSNVITRVEQTQWGKRRLLTQLQVPRSTYYRWRARELQGKQECPAAITRVPWNRLSSPSMKTLGAKYNDEEHASFMAIWRYSGHLMGIPETILFHGADEALRLYDIGLMCEPDFPIESIVMAHSLVNSAPLIAGMTDPTDRRKLAKYVYRISRGLIGKETADSLQYPYFSSFGVVWWFRIQQRYGDILGKLLLGRRQDTNYSRFTSLLETAVFDEEGIRYTLPDNVYAEESTKW